MTRTQTLIAFFATASLAIGSPIFLITKVDDSVVKVSEADLQVAGNDADGFSIAGIPLEEIASVSRAPQALDAPEVTLGEVTATSVDVEWLPVEGAAGYEVIVKSGNTIIATETVDADCHTFTASNLDPDDEYTISVIATAEDADYNSEPTSITATTPLWFSAGDGSAEAPYEIIKGSQLMLMSRLVNTDPEDESQPNEYASASYILTRDIDMADIQGFTPIGDAQGSEIIQNPDKHLFSGEFNGNSHTISGLALIAENESTAMVSLFGAVSGAKIHNLTLQGTFSAKGEVAIAAGLAAVMTGSSTISNCSFSGSVTATSAHDTATAAGLVGLFMAGELKDASVTISDEQVISATGVNPDAGGIIGYGHAGVISNPRATISGRIEAISTTTERIAEGQSAGAGGMVGTAFGSYITGGTATINGQILSRATCDAESQTATTTASAGGLCGHYAADMLADVEATIAGSVTAEASDLAYSGGLVGQQARNGYSANGLTVTLSTNGQVKAEALNPAGGNSGSYAGGMYGIVSFQNAAGAVSAANAQIDGSVLATSANSAIATVGGVAGSSASISYSSVQVSATGSLKAQNDANASAGALTGILSAGNVTGCAATVDGMIQSSINAGGLIGVASGTRFTKKNIRACYTIINGAIAGSSDSDTPKIGAIVGLNNSYAPASACFWYAPAESNIQSLSGATGASDTGRLANTSQTAMEEAAEEMNDYLDSYQWTWDATTARLILTPTPEEEEE